MVSVRPAWAVLLLACAISGCETLVPSEARTPSVIDEGNLTEDQKALVDACNSDASDYSDFRLIEELPHDGGPRRFRLLAEVDLDQDGSAETVEVGARVPAARFGSRPVNASYSECVGPAFSTVSGEEAQ